MWASSLPETIALCSYFRCCFYLNIFNVRLLEGLNQILAGRPFASSTMSIDSSATFSVLRRVRLAGLPAEDQAYGRNRNPVARLFARKNSS